ncbi:putative conjugative transfer TraA domain protein [Orientia tsutsugamushi str. Gilliam]|uniref:Putative conjugative transfer TraA domain protein n=1 Tax=Orientia tsutsugamushi str. Gilliam TaxID=1359184 RepID=A0A0F3M4C4_ORITS|nr:hypothetical protein [Orientia tsutsugamushi]KJV50620.1 putative conjugative transfer TraA domain protein [Orientia tsutsugamushi str. Gilliam]
MIHEIAKEETNAYFAELGLPYRVTDIKQSAWKAYWELNILKLGI